MDTAVQSRTLDSKPIAPSLFAHFVLRSSNLPAMVDWYSTVLNMHVVKRNDFICFLTYDDEHHRLAIVNIPDLHKPDQRSWGLAHVAYTFRNVGELLSTYRRLKKAGIEGLTRHDLRRSLGTTMAAMGAGDRIIAAALGHVSMSAVRV